jgi:hypothetical protein
MIGLRGTKCIAEPYWTYSRSPLREFHIHELHVVRYREDWGSWAQRDVVRIVPSNKIIIRDASSTLAPLTLSMLRTVSRSVQTESS